MATTHLLYLHGFRSSPQSTKARQMAQRIAQDFPQVRWWCPQLPPSPKAAMQMVLQGVAAWPRATTAVVGSSLGGFYAACVATQLGYKAVLLNPAVEPARDLAASIGEQSAWHDPQSRFFFEPGFVDELRELHAKQGDLPAHACLLVAAKGDEVLDWREMVARFPRATLRLVERGDHALSDFDDHLKAILHFLDLLR